MKQEIIDQMNSLLGSGTWAAKDFIMDRTSLQFYDGLFFWVSREDGTSLCKIDFMEIYETMNQSQNAESNRIAWFQDFYLFLMGVMYWAEDKANKLYYYDCNTLTQVDLETAKRIYDGLLGKMYCELQEAHLKELKISRQRLPIRLDCSISALKKALYHAESLGDNSLLQCLRRLRYYRRCAVNQSVHIYKDFDEHCFTFSNRADEKCLLNGGIILHDYMKANRWSIHT